MPSLCKNHRSWNEYEVNTQANMNFKRNYKAFVVLPVLILKPVLVRNDALGLANFL